MFTIDSNYVNEVKFLYARSSNHFAAVAVGSPEGGWWLHSDGCRRTDAQLICVTLGAVSGC